MTDDISKKIRKLENELDDLSFDVNKLNNVINNIETKNKEIKNGIGLGVVSAMVISYTANNSILWMFIHGFFNWFYIAYYILK